MRRTARRLAGELRGKLEEAIGVGAVAVAGMAFLAVVREGLETALLFYAAAQGAAVDRDAAARASRSGCSPPSLHRLGLYAGAVRINLQPVLHRDRRRC